MATIYGSELNIYQIYITRSELSSEDKIFEKLKQTLFEFDGYRETYPVDLDMGQEVKVNDLGQLFIDGLDNYIVFGHYFIYSDASYETVDDKDLMEIDKREFLGWTVFEIPCDEDGDNLLECQGTGESIEEKTFAFFKKGDEVIVLSESIRAPFDVDDDLDEEQEKLLVSLSKSIHAKLNII